MRHRVLSFVLIAGCAADVPAPRIVERPAMSRAPSPADQLALAIEANDLQQALAVLCNAYAAQDMGCAETVYLELLEANDVMARSGVLHNVKLPPMPPIGGGFAYWDNWSTILSAGSWQPRRFFTDDEDARLVANMLLVSVLAHELGHHVAARYGCSSAGPREELLADELSLPVMKSLIQGRLVPLHARMRLVAEQMIEAVPPARRVEVPREGDFRGWIADQKALPSEVPSYVTLHLSRQRRLLAEPELVASVAATRCKGAFSSRVQTRRPSSGHVRTLEQRLPSSAATELLAIDPNGQVWSATIGPQVTIQRLSAPFGLVEVTLPEAASDVNAFAAFTDGRFALADFQTVWLVEKGVLSEVGRSKQMPTALAFDAQGTLFAATRSDTSWQVGAVGATPGPARLSLFLDQDGSRWSDGPLADARASPQSFALLGAQVVFADQARDAVRIASQASVLTMAGELAGRRDGRADKARFFAIEAIGRLATGGIAVVEQDFAHKGLIVRVIEP